MHANICSIARYSFDQFTRVNDLLAAGLPDAEISAATEVGAHTVRAWRTGRYCTRFRRRAMATPGWRPSEPRHYAYVLGIYLGDGWIHVPPRRSPCLLITLDAAYPGIVQECAQALGRVFPDTRPCRYPRDGGSVEALQLSHPTLPFAFPQHGPGRKHERAIVLAPWQAEITAAHPRPLLRGLIHSDGCRTVNRFSARLPSGRVAEYEYPRYFFSNLSADIRAIFCAHCDLLGIRWTQSNPRNISISHRRSVALMDRFVGPKQ